MKSLLAKELKFLVPTGILFTFLFCLDFFFYPLLQAPDQTSWLEVQDALDPEGSEWIAPLLYVMGVSFGFSLYPREYEERSIDFLHTLPVTRGQIFFCKWLAAELMVASVLTLNQLGAFLLQSANTTALESTQFSVVTACKLWGLEFALASMAVAHGLLFSFGRQYGLLLMALVAWGISHIVSLRPELWVLSPVRLAHPEFHGRSLLIPWQGLFIQSAGMLACLGLAFWLWSRRGHQLTRAFFEVRDTRWKRVGCGCTTALLFFFIFIHWAVNSEPSSEEKVFPSFETARVQTEFYNFTFPVNLRERALTLALGADALYSRARARLQAPHSGIVIADLTDLSFEHLGIASHEKIRMDITQHQEPELLQHVLFHETCHVLIRRVAGRRWADFSAYTSFFDEGACEYLAYGAVQSSRDRHQARRHAIATYDRHQLLFKELIEQKELSRRLDEACVYTVGEIWIQALVECYGEEAPALVVKAAGRENAPSDLSAMEFWQDTLQAAGLNLERVRSRWLKLMDQGVKDEAEFLEKLPRVWAEIDEDPEGVRHLHLHTDRDLPPEWPGLVARVRARPGDRAEGLKVEGGVCRLPNRYRDSFEYQVGVDFHEGTYAYWEEWKPVR